MSFGYTQTNANIYCQNRVTDTGATGPGLTNISCDLPQTIKDELVKAMDAAIRCSPKQYMEYDIDQIDPVRSRYRKSLNVAMGVEYDKNGKPLSCEIKCEAFTIIIPLVLSAHRDVMNDNNKYADSVIQINHTFSISDDNIPMSEKLKDWMRSCGVNNVFPVSIIMYSRKVIANISSKIDATEQLPISPPIILHTRSTKKEDIILRGTKVLFKAINIAFFDTDSQRSIINSTERNGIINPDSLRAAIVTFEMKQDY